MCGDCVAFPLLLLLALHGDCSSLETGIYAGQTDKEQGRKSAAAMRIDRISALAEKKEGRRRKKKEGRRRKKKEERRRGRK